MYCQFRVHYLSLVLVNIVEVTLKEVNTIIWQLDVGDLDKPPDIKPTKGGLCGTRKQRNNITR